MCQWYVKSSLSLLCVFIANTNKISEQPCSNGEPIRDTVLWEGTRTTHKLYPRMRSRSVGATKCTGRTEKSGFLVCLLFIISVKREQKVHNNPNVKCNIFALLLMCPAFVPHKFEAEGMQSKCFRKRP